MPEKKESARATVILALVAVAVGCYVLLFGLQTLIYFEAHHWAASSPFLRDVPQPLPSTVASPIREKGLSFYGFQFGAPWKGIDKQNSQNDRSEIDFKSGAVLLFFNPEGEKNIVDSIRTGNPQTYQQYRTSSARIFSRITTRCTTRSTALRRGPFTPHVQGQGRPHQHSTSMEARVRSLRSKHDLHVPGGEHSGIAVWRSCD